ncbi:MAG: class I SAM-dependent methyltransferase [Thermoflavifilum sp.]|nr:class I SAM-dependent methyltransferase [Thermoflavifilum sp.]
MIMPTHQIHYTRCPICFSEQIALQDNIPDHAISKKYFEVWKCNQCNGFFTQDIPDESAIDAYYQSDQYVSHSDTRKGLLFTAYHLARKISMQLKYRWINRAMRRYASFSLPRPTRLLDIGCGTGTFLHFMQQKGWHVNGVEPSATARNIARNKYQLQLDTPDQLPYFPAQSFALITLWHVLEHIHELHDTLSQVRHLLHPGGLLMIAVPNANARDRQLYGSYWAAYDVPRHLYHFTPASMEYLLNMHQLHLLEVKPMRMDVFYIAWLSARYQHKRWAALQGLRVATRCWLYSWWHPLKASSLLYIIQC